MNLSFFKIAEQNNLFYSWKINICSSNIFFNKNILFIFIFKKIVIFTVVKSNNVSQIINYGFGFNWIVAMTVLSFKKQKSKIYRDFISKKGYKLSFLSIKIN